MTLSRKSDSSRVSQIVIYDEAPFYWEADCLKEELRAIDVVPDASYKVEGDKVFVFDLLVREARNALSNIPLNDKETRRAVVLSLLPQAWVSVDKAISEHGVVPEPFRLLEDGSGYMIVNSLLHAAIPMVLPSKELAWKALGILIKGGVVNWGYEQGEVFTYEGQRYRLLKPFDINSLPPCPGDLEEGSKVDEQSACGFPSGFAPLTLCSWTEIIRANRAVVSTIDAIEALEKTTNATDALKLYDLSTVHFQDNEALWETDELEAAHSFKRQCSELANIPDNVLIPLMEAYSLANNMSCPSTHELGVFILGSVALKHTGFKSSEGGTLHGADVLGIGRAVLFSLAKKSDALDALKWGVAFNNYSREVRALWRRVSDVRSFSDKGGPKMSSTGSGITTIMDVLRYGRKLSGPMSQGTQKAGDFSAEA